MAGTATPTRRLPETPSLGTGLTVIALSAAAFGTFKLFQYLDLIKDGDDRNSAKYEALMKRWTEPTYGDIVLAAYQKAGGKVPKKWWSIPTITTGDQATKIAVRIWDAKGFFNDDEEKLYSVFREFEYGLDVWKVNKAFKAKYDNRNIYDFIQDFTSEEERAEMFDIIKDLKDAPKPTK